MSILEKYRSSTDFREILRIPQKASSLAENFLWQSHALAKSIVPIHHFEIDFVSREVVVFFDSLSYRLDKELPLYVKLDYRTSVFKITEFNESQNSVHFVFPKELKTLELRSHPRHQFSSQKEQTLSLRPNLSGAREHGDELQVRAIDISQFGFGLIIYEHNLTFLKNNRILWVAKIGAHALDYPVLAEVAYINNEVDPKYSSGKQKDLKVGLRLSGVIPPEIYKNLLD